MTPATRRIAARSTRTRTSGRAPRSLAPRCLVAAAPERTRSAAQSSSIAAMVAALWVLADAAEEGRKVVLSMLVVGLVFLAVIGLGELNSYRAAKRKQAKLRRPL